MSLNRYVALVYIAISLSVGAPAVAPQQQNKIDQKKFSINGVLWSKGKKKVFVKKKNEIEYSFIKNGEPKKVEAIGPFVSGQDSIFGIEYNLEIEHEKPFILNFETWKQHVLLVDGILFDAGLTSDRSVYWALEGLDVGKTVETFVLLYSKDGERLLREKVVKAGVDSFVVNGRKFDVNVRLARGIDLIN